MKRQWMMAVAALAAASLACSISVPRLETGPTETVTVNEALPAGDAVAEVNLKMGAGTLSLTGGADGLVSGEIKYNIAEWKPTVTNQDGKVTIEQGSSDGISGIPGDDIVNDWELKLGNAPMELTLDAGAYEGAVDLSGVPLRNLSISDGASSSEVKFDSLNPEEMDELRYDTGASSVTLTGLANANFTDLIFKGGVGDYTLDFSGALQRDASVDITTGVSSLRIVIPEGMTAKVTVDGAISDVDTEGTWTTSGDTYETSGSGPILTINVDMGVGSLKLVNE